jgi:hypothetical protein
MPRRKPRPVTARARQRVAQNQRVEFRSTCCSPRTQLQHPNRRREHVLRAGILHWSRPRRRRVDVATRRPRGRATFSGPNARLDVAAILAPENAQSCVLNVLKIPFRVFSSIGTPELSHEPVSLGYTLLRQVPSITDLEHAPLMSSTDQII